MAEAMVHSQGGLTYSELKKMPIPKILQYRNELVGFLNEQKKRDR